MSESRNVCQHSNALYVQGVFVYSGCCGCTEGIVLGYTKHVFYVQSGLYVQCMYRKVKRVSRWRPPQWLFRHSQYSLYPVLSPLTGWSRTHAARSGWCSQDVLAQLSKLEPEDPRRPAAVDLVTSNFDKFGDNGEVRLV